MSFWPSAPFLRALVPLAAGVLTYDPLAAPFMARVLASALLILIAGPFLPIAARYRIRHLSAIAFLASVLCLGYWIMFFQDLRNHPRWIGHGRPDAICVTIINEPRKTSRGISFTLRILSAREGHAWSRVRGYLQAFARGGDYAIGDTMVLHSDMHPLRSPNKGYLRYMQRNNILHTISPEPGTRVLGKAEHGPVILLRKAVLRTLDSLFTERNEKAMAKALLLGYRADMEKELLNAYTNTGVVHVIAVSGMHLALIYSLVSFSLKPIRNRRVKKAGTILTLGLLWLFALVCGGSPSVARSALMFSFILWADIFGREHRQANALAGSAFILICLDPVILYDIGFQLSYAAVAGLMLYSGPLTRLFRPGNRILKYGWSAICATLAAQVLATPLVLLHFGQFPLLFLPANMFAVPISGIILILLILSCAAHPVGMGWLPASLAGALMRYMNQAIEGLGNTRFTVLENMHIKWYDAVNIYIVILAITLWIRSKK